jgi:hypothetical protein
LLATDHKAKAEKHGNNYRLWLMLNNSKRAQGRTEQAARDDFWRLCTEQNDLPIDQRHPVCKAVDFDIGMSAILQGILPP